MNKNDSIALAADHLLDYNYKGNARTAFTELLEYDQDLDALVEVIIDDIGEAQESLPMHIQNALTPTNDADRDALRAAIRSRLHDMIYSLGPLVPVDPNL